MKGYFLDLARLALGTGARLEPRPGLVAEAAWIEESVLGEEVPGVRLAPVVVAADASPASVHQTFQQTTHESHAHLGLAETIQEGERTVERERLERDTRHETVREVQARETLRSSERTVEERATEVRETRETLRELVIEARTIRERWDRTTVRAEFERAVAFPERAVERRTEVERLVREVQRTATSRETERTVEVRVERDAPSVEVHIGRIEVRAPAPGPARKDEARKPKGVIDLNEYLRERSRGAS